MNKFNKHISIINYSFFYFVGHYFKSLITFLVCSTTAWYTLSAVVFYQVGKVNHGLFL